MKQELLNRWNNYIIWYLYEKPAIWFRNQKNGLKYGIRNLIIWFPIIWNDRYYDSWFMLNILAFKIKTMSDGIENAGIHVGYEEDVKNMRRVVQLLENLRDEKYNIQSYSSSNHESWREKPDTFEDCMNKFNQAQKNFYIMCNECFDIIKREYKKWWD